MSGLCFLLKMWIFHPVMRSCPGTSFLRWDIIAPVFILLIIISLTSRQSVICPWYSWKCSHSIQIGCPLWQSDGHFSNVFEIQSTRACDYISMNSLDDSLWWYINYICDIEAVKMELTGHISCCCGHRGFTLFTRLTNSLTSHIPGCCDVYWCLVADQRGSYIKRAPLNYST